MRRTFLFLGLITVLVASAGCDSGGEPGGDGVQPDTTLAALAARHGIDFGTAAETQFTSREPDYLRLLSGQFSVVTPGNAMKFGPLRPNRASYSFSAADALVDFAEANGQKVRGHTLVWHSQLPGWVSNGTWTRQQLIDVLAEHVSAVVGRYAGRVYAWDVVNEPFNEDGTLRETIFLDVIGPDYIELAFRMAHAADPNALLFLNEYNAEGSGAKANAVYDLAQELLASGVPIHGIGMQMHLTNTWGPSAQDLAANMRRLGDLGLEVHITEMDVRIQMPASQAALVQQATIYADLLGVCLTQSSCGAFTIWGFTDRYSWVPGAFTGFGAALIFDEEFQPKPAYFSIRQILEE